MSQSAISASAPREPGTIVIAGGLFSLYAAALVFLSMTWPRYGLLDLGVRIPPYTLLSISAWLVIPVLLAARSDYRTRLGDAVAEKKWLIAAFVAWMAWRLLSSALGDSPADSITETIKEIALLWPLVPLTLILMTYQSGLVAFSGW